VSENARVDDFAGAISAGDLVTAGALMTDSHRSLSGDFDSSTRRIDALCDLLSATGGVHGARMTGGGWGGCVVALTEPGAVEIDDFEPAWLVRASAGASLDMNA
jgi:galactokinase